MQRTAAISDHLIKTLTGFLVKSDLDDSSYALMREVSSKGGREGLGERGRGRGSGKGQIGVYIRCVDVGEREALMVKRL